MKSLLSVIAFSCVALCWAKTPSFLENASPWADATIKTLSFQEKVAQCFMPLVPGKLDEEHIKIVQNFIKTYKIGGIFVTGPITIEQQVHLINRLQSASSVPLLVGEDLEFGPAMRLTNGMQWPFAMTFGAVQDNDLVYKAAVAMARQARAIGAHVTASPVADINSNAQNPIINIRSYGAAKEQVIPKVLATVKGLEDGGVIPCIKHFPGHGDTSLDSHKALPILRHSQQRMFSVELAPFQAAIDEGVPMIMTGHLSVPSFDASGTPATLSKLLIQDLLQHAMRFEGLIMTDALIMKALPAVSPIDINLRALEAGNDVLIYAQAIPETIQVIVDYATNPDISEADRNAVEAVFTEKAYKILKAKEWLGLAHNATVDPENASMGAGTPDDYALLGQIYKAAMSVVRDAEKKIPLKTLNTKNVLLITRGEAEPFVQQFSLHHRADHRSVDEGLGNVGKKLSEYDAIIYVYVPPVYMVGGLAARMLTGKLEPHVLTDLEKLRSAHKNVIMVLCASPFMLYSLPDDLPVLVAYESQDLAQRAAADALCGKAPIIGRLPLVLSDNKVAHEKDL